MVMATERTALEVPFPDPLGLFQGKVRLWDLPSCPWNPLAGLCKRWLGRIFEARGLPFVNSGGATRDKLKNLQSYLRFRRLVS